MNPRPLSRGERLLLLDIGNTHCHIGIASANRILANADVRTIDLISGKADSILRRWIGRHPVNGAAMCSVVPDATPSAQALVRSQLGLDAIVLTHRTLRGVGLDYPKPSTIGPDRLANSIAVRHLYPPPVVVVDFGTAVTFDIVDRHGNYVGGIIAPGLAAMTDYLHEKTALLPRIRIREVRSAIGRSTEHAMLIGAVHGYRGLVRELIHSLRKELKAPDLPVVATGGYAHLIARGVDEITSVRLNLTLEGLRLLWQAHHSEPATQAALARSPFRSRRTKP